MITPAQIRSVFFDFAGTLAPGRYFEPLGQPSLDAVGELVFGDNSVQWADPWMRGELASEDIVSYLSDHLPEARDVIQSALQRGCLDMSLNPAVYEFALQQRIAGRKTALVTMNMDVFSDIVVPAHGLGDLFDLVLNTADYRTLDKSTLWCKALDEFGSEYSFAKSLLVDDSPEMIALFRSLGGQAVQYVSDEAFQAWLGATGFLTEMKYTKLQRPRLTGGRLYRARERCFGDSGGI
ncbi:hypothetical protein KKG90_04280 [Candidatus Bipolaricaulota bacterium]|nr:hypothetical protein [Candidatus Bipolaricaulota bacterium]